MVRVRVLLRSQPLLAAATSRPFQALAQPEPDPAAQEAAQQNPKRITEAEKAAARDAEASYERAVAGLSEEGAESTDELDQVAAAIRRSGGEVLERELLPAAIVVRVDVELLGELADLAGVQAVQPAPVEKSQMDVSVQAVGAPSWWAAGFTGGTGSGDQVPADAAVQDEAPDPTHLAFAGVTLDNSPAAFVDDHGTHTAGIIASNDAIYRGVAYGVDRIIGADDSLYALGITDGSGNPGASDPAEAINRSFGDAAIDDDEDDGTDVLTTLYGLARAEGAGNDNVDGGPPTVGNIGRNYLSVAAFNDVGTVTSTDDVVLGVSSRGPTPGGRKKPDLTAPGGSVIAPSLFWNENPCLHGGTPDPNGSCPDFTGMSGTSFSSPHVAGALTLLEGAGIGDSMAQRAILINSARDWNGTNTGLDEWVSPQTGWRPEVGWGELDLTTALAQRGNYRLGSVAGGEAAFYRAAAPAGAKATLAFELRGYFVGFPNPGTQTITYTQSDLNLRQYTSAGVEIPPPADLGTDGGPDAVDPNDTVEQVRAPSAQTITYKVEAASTVEGASTEPFAITGAAPLQQLVAPVTRPTASVASPTTTVGCNQPVTITTALANDSPDLESTSSAVALELPSGVQLVSGAQTQPVSGGTLETSTTSEQHAWTVQATTDGQKTFTVAGAGQGLGTPFRRTEAVTLTADCIAPETAIDSGPGDPTNDPTPTFAFSATGGASGFDCSIDSAAFEPCSSGFTAAAVPDGSHSFAVRARDAVGNVDASPSSRSFTIDTAAPETTMTGGPSGITADAAPRFFFGGGGASGFECLLDSGAFAPCTSGFHAPELPDGPHTFKARAVDEAGNTDPTPAVRVFRVDTRVSGARVGGKRRQRVGHDVSLHLRGSAGEDVSLSAGGEVSIAGGTSFRVSRAGSSARARQTVRLTMGLNRRGSRAVRHALRDGKRVGAVVRVRFEDDVGNSTARTRSIRLR